MPAKHYNVEISKNARKAHTRARQEHFSEDDCREEPPIKGNINWAQVRADLGLEPEKENDVETIRK
jgi:hypothetical protein